MRIKVLSLALLAVLTIAFTATADPILSVGWPDAIGFSDSILFNNAYEDIFVGFPYRVAVTVSNTGDADLNVDAITSDNPAFTIEPAQLLLAAGTSADVAITLTFEQIGEQLGHIAFHSNGGDLVVPALGVASDPPRIEVEPDTLDIQLPDGGDIGEVFITLRNNGGSVLRWYSRLDAAGEPERQEVEGPHRDDPGDVLLEFGWNRAGEGSQKGVAYDYDDDLLLLCTNHPNWLAVLDPANNYEMVREWQSNRDPMTAAYLDGTIFVVMQDANLLARYDNQGNDLGDLNLGFTPTAVAASRELGVLLVVDDEDGSIKVMPPGQQAIGVIPTEDVQRFAGGRTRSICWFDKDLDGKLWINRPGEIRQLAVDEDRWRVTGVVNSWQTQAPDPSERDAIAHDKYNLIYGSLNNPQFLVYDDGNSETYWIELIPAEGQLDPGREELMVLILNAAGLRSGNWLATLRIFSNDPAAPQIDIPITFSVPIWGLWIEWAAEAGYPDMIDFNRVYPMGVYVGESYAVPFTVRNLGFDPVEVNDIRSNNACFDCTPTNFALGPDEEVEVTATFSSDAPGDYEAILTFSTNVPDHEYSIWVRGEAASGANIDVAPRQIIYQGAHDRSEAQTIQIANSGDRDLHWSASIESVEQPDDRNQRFWPRYFQWERAGQFRYKAGIAFVPEDNLLAVTCYSPNWIAILDPANAMSVVREWQPDGNPMGMTYFHGKLYAVLHDRGVLAEYDLDGNHLGNFQLNFAPLGVASSEALGVLFVISGETNDIAVLNENGEQVGVIGRAGVWEAVGGGWVYSISWADVDPGGQLWVNKTGQIYQLAVNTDDWTITGVVCNWATNAQDAQPWDGLGHDRYNLVYGSYGSISYEITDDGSEEIGWMTAAPLRGIIAPEDSTEITVTLLPWELRQGLYRADIHLSSNDPDDPEVIVPVVWHANWENPPLNHFTNIVPTDVTLSMFVTRALFDDNPMASHWEIGVFTPGGVLAGAGIWTDLDTLGITVYGDGLWSEQVEGFRDGERMSFKVWDNIEDCEYPATAEYAHGDDRWAVNGLAMLSLSAVPDESLTIRLNRGWNIMSMNLILGEEYHRPGVPGIQPDILLVWEPIRDHIILVKDENGRFYAPRLGGFNNIAYYNVQEGYMVKMDSTLDATWVGQRVNPQADVPISRGWNLIAYFPTYQLDCEPRSNPPFYVISPIIDHVLIAKDEMGRFTTGVNFSNMNPWTQGEGYMIKVNANVVLNYPHARGQEAGGIAGNQPSEVVGSGLTHWPEPVRTGRNMSLLIEDCRLKIEDCREIGVFTKAGLCVGSSSSSSSPIGLAVWGDDPTTDAIDGAVEGEELFVRVWDGQAETPVLLTVLPQGLCTLRGDVASGYRDPEAVSRGDEEGVSRVGQPSRLTEEETDGRAGMPVLLERQAGRLSYATDDLVVATLDVGAQGLAPLPTEYSLAEPYPNPFNGQTTIAYSLPAAAFVRIVVTDINGREVSELASEQVSIGVHRVTWKAEGVASGVYLLKMEAGGVELSRKVVLMR